MVPPKDCAAVVFLQIQKWDKDDGSGKGKGGIFLYLREHPFRDAYTQTTTVNTQTTRIPSVPSLSPAPGTPGNAWEHLGTVGNGRRDHLWEHLGTPGNTWEHLRTPGNTWPAVPSGNSVDKGISYTTTYRVPSTRYHISGAWRAWQLGPF